MKALGLEQKKDPPYQIQLNEKELKEKKDKNGGDLLRLAQCDFILIFTSYRAYRPFHQLHLVPLLRWEHLSLQLSCHQYVVSLWQPQQQMQ